MKLSDLKVGDKFRFRLRAGECILVGEARKRQFDGTFEWAYWSETLGYKYTIGDNEVELVTDPPEPKYRPYSDLRPLVGRVVKPKSDENNWQHQITSAAAQNCFVGGSHWTSEELYTHFVFLDGTPCGELVE